MGKKTWTSQQEVFLIANYKKLTNDELISYLGISYNSLVKKAYRLGFKKPRHLKATNKDKKKDISPDVIDLIDKVSKAEIARLHKTTRTSINRLIRTLGLTSKIKDAKSKWTAKDIKFLTKNYGNLSFTELCIKLKRSKYAIRKKASTLGLTSKLVQNTSIELQVKKVLDKLSINYTQQAILKTGKPRGHNYRPDFLLDNQVIIECQGDYFHCNPNKYPNGPTSKVQIVNVARDQDKQSWYQNKNYKVLWIWESECEDSIILNQLINDFIGRCKIE